VPHAVRSFLLASESARPWHGHGPPANPLPKFLWKHLPLMDTRIFDWFVGLSSVGWRAFNHSMSVWNFSADYLRDPALQLHRFRRQLKIDLFAHY